MKVFFLILILITSYYCFKKIWLKTKLKKHFQKYKIHLIKVTSSLNNLKSKDLDQLSLSGFNLVIYLFICFFPYIICFMFVLKIIHNYTLSLIISSLIFVPFLFDKK